jgi:hypothetical protein
MRKVFLQVAVISGFLTGLGCFLFLLLLYVVGLDGLGQYKLLYMPMYALGIVGGLKFFRDYRNGGYLSGSRAVMMSLIINLLAAVSYAIMLYFLLTLIYKDVLVLHQQELYNWLLNHRDEYVNQFGIKQYEAQFAEVKNTSAAYVTLIECVKTILIGFVLAMAVAVILKRNPPPPTT